MDIPMPAEMNQTGPSLRLVMHIWAPKKEEVLRVQAIRELTGYQAWQKYVMNPAGMLEKFDEIYKNPSAILRTHIEMYMPILAVLPAQGLAIRQPIRHCRPSYHHMPAVTALIVGQDSSPAADVHFGRLAPGYS
jgi:hypothetical protein